MPPVVAAVVAAVGAIATAVSAVVSAIGAFFAWYGALGTFAKLAIQIGISLLINEVFAPKAASVEERQGQSLNVTLGEYAREALLGRVASAGSLINIWNDGSDNEFETLVVDLADHEIDAIEGVIINDKEYTLSSQGSQSHADFQDGESKLSIQWALGTPNQTTVTHITSEAVTAGQWTSGEASNGFKGFAYAVARYKISSKVWKAGRPRFIWIVRGAKLYDPRKDSSVGGGGSGTHRWGDPTTYEWSENARLCHYNFVRGIYSYPLDSVNGQLMVGPGRSAEEAPPIDVIAGANLCDEEVPLKAGGTEKRYRVSAVIPANERWIDVEEHFAAAMGGQLVERAGTIGVDPGVWKPYETEIVDDDFISGAEVRYQQFQTRDQLINTVQARFVDPKQLWNQATTPVRKVQADIDADGEVRDATLDLVFVFSQTQAQRIAEIRRRLARLQKTATITVGPKYMLLEDGDWIRWRSVRRFNGESVGFRVQGVGHSGEGQTMLLLSEISSAVYDWNPTIDELDYGPPQYTAPSLPANPRLFSSLNVNAGMSGVQTGATLSVTVVGQIDVLAQTVTLAGGETISIPSGSITGLANSTKYWVARDRQAGTFVATSSFSTATAWFTDSTGRYIVLGNATTTDGGGGGGGTGGGGGCVVGSMFMADGRRAREVDAGEMVRAVLHTKPPQMTWAQVMSAEPRREPCVKLVSESGVELECSTSTPIEQPDRTTIYADGALGRFAIVWDADGGLRWERIVACVAIGVHEVARISAGGATYAAGLDPRRLMFTHNPEKP